MITLLIKKLVGLGLSEKIARIVLITAAAVLLFAGSAGLKACYDHRVIKEAVAESNVKELQKETRANDKAAEARASDSIRLHEQDKERQDAIAETTDEAPTESDLALNCKRLQQSGQDTTRFPACRGR